MYDKIENFYCIYPANALLQGSPPCITEKAIIIPIPVVSGDGVHAEVLG